MVQARSVNNSRWMVSLVVLCSLVHGGLRITSGCAQLYDVSSDKVAVFSYAGLFAMSDNYYSGNLLPADQRVPEGTLYEQRLSVFGHLCVYVHAHSSINRFV